MKFRHYRTYNNFGGATLAYDITLGCYGISVCSPKDQFCRRRGREIASSRASHAMMNVEPDVNDAICIPNIDNYWNADIVTGRLYKEVMYCARSAVVDAIMFSISTSIPTQVIITDAGWKVAHES